MGTGSEWVAGCKNLGSPLWPRGATVGVNLLLPQKEKALGNTQKLDLSRKDGSLRDGK